MSNKLTADGYARGEALDSRSKLDKRLDDIMPGSAESSITAEKDLEDIKLTREQYSAQTEELFESNPDIDIEGIVEHFGGHVPDDIKADMMKLLAEHMPQRASNYKEFVDQTILEDKIIATDKKVKRDNKAFGKTASGEPRRLEETDKKFLDNIMDIL